jgi:hypothetical protein
MPMSFITEFCVPIVIHQILDEDISPQLTIAIFIHPHSQAVRGGLRQFFRRILFNCSYKGSSPYALPCRICLSPQKLPAI